MVCQSITLLYYILMGIPSKIQAGLPILRTLYGLVRFNDASCQVHVYRYCLRLYQNTTINYRTFYQRHVR